MKKALLSFFILALASLSVLAQCPSTPIQGTELGNVSNIAELNGKLYVIGDPPVPNTKTGLYVIVGTTMSLVKEFTYSPYTRLLFVVNNKLFFHINGGGNGPAMWISDGTAAGTTEVSPIQVDKSKSYDVVHMQSPILNYKGKALFLKEIETGKYMLHTSDGTAAGTKPLCSATNAFSFILAQFSDRKILQVLNDKIYFVNNFKLIHTDGTDAGTKTMSGVVEQFGVNLPGKLLTVLPNGFGVFNLTTEQLTTKTLPQSSFSAPGTFLYQDKAYFTSFAGNPSTGILYEFDEKKDSLKTVLSFGGVTFFNKFYVKSGKKVFATSGKLYAFDFSGASPTFGMVGDIKAPVKAAQFSPDYKGKVYFENLDDNGRNFAVSDGTASGTKAICIVPGTTDNYTSFYVFGNSLYFFAGKIPHKYEGNMGTGIFSKSEELPVQLVPNPSSGMFSISALSETAYVEVYTLLGTRVHTQIGNATIDLSNQAKGMYLVHIQEGAKRSTAKLLID